MWIHRGQPPPDKHQVSHWNHFISFLAKASRPEGCLRALGSLLWGRASWKHPLPSSQVLLRKKENLHRLEGEKGLQDKVNRHWTKLFKVWMQGTSVFTDGSNTLPFCPCPARLFKLMPRPPTVPGFLALCIFVPSDIYHLIAKKKKKKKVNKPRNKNKTHTHTPTKQNVKPQTQVAIRGMAI